MEIGYKEKRAREKEKSVRKNGMSKRQKRKVRRNRWRKAELRREEHPKNKKIERG